MYSGEVTIKNENVMDLLAVSDYLQVVEVKQFCFEFLESILSSDNWYAIRSAADLYQNKHLQNQVDEYMSKNFDAIVQTDALKWLDKGDLCACMKKLERSHIKEESIFNGLVNWCKVDDPSRKNDFPELFEQLIDLYAIPVEIIEEIVLKEDLVTENKQCLNVLTKSFCQRNKRFGKTKIVSFGGMKAQGKCIEVYNSSNQLPKHYPDLPIWLYGHCSLMTSNHAYCIGGSIDDENSKMPACKNVWQMNINDSVLKWKEVAPLSRQFFSPLAGAVFRDVLVVAGLAKEKILMSLAEFYLSATNEWRSASPLQEVRSWCALAANDQHLYVLGGWYENKYLPTVERTANLKEQWQQI